MFHADYFDFYSNFWNIRKTIGNSGWDLEGSIRMYFKKDEGIGYLFMINTSEFSKIEYFQEPIIDFGKYLKSLNSK